MSRGLGDVYKRQLFNTFCDTFITIQIHFSVDFYFEIWYNTYDCDENYT